MKKTIVSLTIFIAVALVSSSLFFYSNLKSNAALKKAAKAQQIVLRHNVVHKTYFKKTKSIPVVHKETKLLGMELPKELNKALYVPGKKYSLEELKNILKEEGFGVKVAKGATSQPMSARTLAVQSKRNHLLIKKKTKQLNNIEKEIAKMKKLLQKIVKKRSAKKKKRRYRYRLVMICKKIGKKKHCKRIRVRIRTRRR